MIEPRRRPGPTLIEWLVVIAIIAVRIASDFHLSQQALAPSPGLI